jgi:tetratricopeptide (TPR) repeat protein
MKPPQVATLTCDTAFPEMVDLGVEEMARQPDLRAAVAEARRAAERQSGPNQAGGRPPAWAVEPGSLAEAVYWSRQLTGQANHSGPEAVMAALNNLGACWRADRRWADAESAYQESLRLRGQYGDRAGEGHTFAELGHLYRDQERWAESETAFGTSLAIAREVGDRWTEAAALGVLADISTVMGQAECAVAYVKQAVAVASTLGNMALEKRLRGQLTRLSSGLDTNGKSADGRSPTNGI